MNKPLTEPNLLANTQFLASARLWLVAACATTLATHALFAFNFAVVIGLLNCVFFAWVQLTALLTARNLEHSNPAHATVPSTPRWTNWLPTLLGALAVGAMAWQYKTVLGKEAGLACLSILATFKLWECRRARDVQVQVGLLFFMQLGVFLREESALALLAVLVSTILTLSAWVFFTTYGETNEQTSVKAQNRKIIFAPLKETLRLAALGLPLAALLFFVFPRIAGPLWGLPQDATTNRMGLSNSLEPGRFAQLAASEALALRAKFEGAVPPPKALYWRGPVLSEFDGLVWRPLASTQRLQANPNLLTLPENYRYTLVAEPHKLNLRVLLDLPLAATGGISLTLQASPVGEAMLERETVQAISTTQLQWGAQRGDNTAQITRQRLAMQPELDLPAGSNPRMFAYAAELRRTLGVNETDPTPFIQAVLKQYATAFTYTLKPPTPLGRKEDAVDGFFFDTRAGYCEHFAASFVVAMRALDFPARIVTGYQGGEMNPQDGWMTVRQSDAHAWAEVLHPTLGWQRIDPTAAVAPWRVESGGAALQSTAGQAATGLSGLNKTARDALLPLRQWAEATARVWQDYGLNYGKDSQKELFKRMGFPDVDANSIAVLLGGAVAVWLLAAGWVHRNRAAKLSAHGLALVKFDRVCRAVKRPRAPSQTPRQWLQTHRPAFNSQQLEQIMAALKAYELEVFASK